MRRCPRTEKRGEENSPIDSIRPGEKEEVRKKNGPHRRFGSKNQPAEKRMISQKQQQTREKKKKGGTPARFDKKLREGGKGGEKKLRGALKPRMTANSSWSPKGQAQEVPEGRRRGPKIVI